MNEFTEIAEKYGLPFAILGGIIYILFREYLKEKQYNRDRDKEDLQVIVELNVFVKAVKEELKEIRKELIDKLK